MHKILVKYKINAYIIESTSYEMNHGFYYTYFGDDNVNR